MQKLSAFVLTHYNAGIFNINLQYTADINKYLWKKFKFQEKHVQLLIQGKGEFFYFFIFFDK